MKFLRFLFIALILLVPACQNKPKAERLTQTFQAYDLSFKLPKGWQADTTDLMEASGGFGFYSADYAGLTYLRLHKGAGFAVMGAWDLSENAATILKTAFARDISNPQPIRVLGYEGTYAYGKIDQGQGIGAVHVTFQDGEETRQIAFIGVVADHWENFEPTFLAIVKSAKRTAETPAPG